MSMSVESYAARYVLPGARGGPEKPKASTAAIDRAGGVRAPPKLERGLDFDIAIGDDESPTPMALGRFRSVEVAAECLAVTRARALRRRIFGHPPRFRRTERPLDLNSLEESCRRSPRS